MKKISESIGEKIRQAREEKNLTQKELGGFLGYSPMGISHFENGIREMKLSDVKKIANYFGKSLSYFIPSGSTLYRASNGSQQEGVQESLEAFDKFLLERKSE